MPAAASSNGWARRPGSTTSGARPWPSWPRDGPGTPSTSTAKTRRLRDRYGRHLMGQGLLLARRLVEAGVGLVQVNLGVMNHWDTHSEQFHDPQEHPAPPLRPRRLRPDRGPRRPRPVRRRPPDRHRRVRPHAARRPEDHRRQRHQLRARSLGRRLHHAGLRRRHPPRTRPGRLRQDRCLPRLHQLHTGRPRRDRLPPGRHHPTQEARDMFGRPFRLNSGTPIAPLLA